MERIADKVFINGNIYTIDDCKPKASCMAVSGDRLIYVGGSGQVDAFIGPNTEIINLSGKSVYPGFIDSHLHMDLMAKMYLNVDIYKKSKQEILEAVRKKAEEGPGQWIYGDGWFEDLWEEKTFPTKEDLDWVAPDNPVLLSRLGGHMYWANSKAFQLAGVSENTPDPQGGEFVRDRNGKLTGCVTDNASIPFNNVLPAVTGKRMQDAVKQVQNHMLQTGLTSYVNLSTTKEFLQDVLEMYQNGELKLRGYYAIQGPSIQETNDLLEEWYAKGITVGNFGNKFTLRAVKLFTDGSLGARSAALSEDYADRPGWRGKLLNTDEQFYAIVDRAASFGFQVITHAIGDRAVEQVMNTYEKVIHKHHLVDPRFRIEHFQVLRDGFTKRAVDLGIIPSMQATNATFNYPMPDERLGDRADHAYAWRKIIDNGSIIAGGTDAPVTPENPLVEMQSAVARTDDHDVPEGGWRMENAVTRMEAIKSQTIWAAYACFEENLKGTLTAGKLADFIVTDEDLMTCPINQIKDVKVIRTVIGGETLWNAGQA